MAGGGAYKLFTGWACSRQQLGTVCQLWLFASLHLRLHRERPQSRCVCRERDGGPPSLLSTWDGGIIDDLPRTEGHLTGRLSRLVVKDPLLCMCLWETLMFIYRGKNHQSNAAHSEHNWEKHKSAVLCFLCLYICILIHQTHPCDLKWHSLKKTDLKTSIRYVNLKVSTTNWRSK